MLIDSILFPFFSSDLFYPVSPPFFSPILSCSPSFLPIYSILDCPLSFNPLYPLLFSSALLFPISPILLSPLLRSHMAIVRNVCNKGPVSSVLTNSIYLDQKLTSMKHLFNFFWALFFLNHLYTFSVIFSI